MALQNSQFNGIIMYRRDYRERDLLVKLLTQKFGKKMFLVKNAKKRGALIAPDILPFTMGSYIGAINQQGISFLNAAKEVTHLEGITNDISKNAYVTYILSLIDSAFHDDQPISLWYQKARTAMTLINEGADEEIITNIVEVQLLPFFGVAPHWQDCVVCHRTDLKLDYSSKYGGLICQNHFHLDDFRLHLDQKTVYYLRQFSVIKLDQISSINVKPATKKMLRKVIDELYEENVGLHLKAKHFIDQMGAWADQLSQSRRDED